MSAPRMDLAVRRSPPKCEPILCINRNRAPLIAPAEPSERACKSLVRRVISLLRLQMRKNQSPRRELSQTTRRSVDRELSPVLPTVLNVTIARREMAVCESQALVGIRYR